MNRIRTYYYHAWKAENGKKLFSVTDIQQKILIKIYKPKLKACKTTMI